MTREEAARILDETPIMVLKPDDIDDFLDAVNIAVAALKKPERKHGRWIDGKTYYNAIERNCSECGQLLTTARSQKLPFCPRCGAIMDECIGEGVN